MAGIGFRLQRILEGDTYSDVIKAHFYSALITSGPWLLSIVTIFCLSFFAPRHLDIFEIMYFKTVIIYIFAFSLIVTGFFQLPLTRYLADRLYAKEEEAVIPVLNSSAAALLVVQAVIGAAAMSGAETGALLKALAVLIYMTISLIWLLMIFLTALRDYEAITGAYVTGAAVAVAAALFLGGRFGLEGYFLGYLLGHLVIAVLLSARIFIEFSSFRWFDAEIFSFFAENKTLISIGVVYNIAIWIDKIVFWNSEAAVQVSSFMNVFPPYDSAVFFAYLTIIPALSFFLIQVETDFYKQYRRFYNSILDKAPYAVIRSIKADMMGSLRRGAGVVVKYQGLLSLLVITFAPELANLLRLPSIQIPIFRVAVIGAFLQSLLLMAVIIILYFDFRRLALGVSLLFLGANAGLTYLTTRLPLPFYGYGYLAAALLSLIVAFYALDSKMNRLEYATFALQPIGRHREEEII